MLDNIVKGIPEPTLRRLPLYLRLLKARRAAGQEAISCTEIATEFRADPTQVRKDLAATGVVGQARIGFGVAALVDAIEEFLGWRNRTDAFLIGAGNLGRALMWYKTFQSFGIHITAAFDQDPAVVGTEAAGVKVLPVERLADLQGRMRPSIGILTVPAEAAQSVADILAANGIRGIWNFSPVVLRVPDGIVVENVLFSTSLAVLTNKLKRQERNGAGHAA